MNAPSRVEANARFTGLSGIVVLVLLLAELVTVVLGAWARWMTILGSVLLGAMVALMLAGHAEPYMHHYRR